MLITSLGHAGFCVETEHAMIVMDPWLSSTGAFDSSWFQLPSNHHMAPLVRRKLSERKRAFVYISHEHKDHFDPEFLATLRAQQFSFIVPAFRRGVLERELKDLGEHEIISCADGEGISFEGGSLTIFVDDSGLNRDSAILVQAEGKSFLNMNDCKLFERLSAIAAALGNLDIFSCQFSGATWHPTCYRYDPERYAAISRKKAISKFESVARAIETLRPQVYLPAAGPACFLDPQLLHLNFERVNIFPRAPELIRFLEKRLKQSSTQLTELMPGDVLDSVSGSLIDQSLQRVTDRNFSNYVLRYAIRMAPIFLKERRATRRSDPAAVLRRLCRELSAKLERMQFDSQDLLPLYFGLQESPDCLLSVDFQKRTVKKTERVLDPDRFYSVRAPAWQVERVLNREITWEDFALTFRVQITRNPDVYQTLLNGFLFMEAEDLPDFCARVLAIQKQQELIEVTAGGQTYLVDRYCPHQRGDLSQGWVEQGHLLTCPRHRWQFDLKKQGACTTNDTSIHAVLKCPPTAVPHCAMAAPATNLESVKRSHIPIARLLNQ